MSGISWATGSAGRPGVLDAAAAYPTSTTTGTTEASCRPGAGDDDLWHGLSRHDCRSGGHGGTLSESTSVTTSSNDAMRRSTQHAPPKCKLNIHVLLQLPNKDLQRAIRILTEDLMDVTV